jgi:DNA-binding XRE family transcriptional regulator
VRALRLAAGISQEAFAAKCGFVRSYMSRIECGKANPALTAVAVIADALRVEVKELFETTCTVVPPAKVKPPAIQVPFAKDGSCFNPTVRRPTTGKFSVGEKGKGNTVQFDSFDEALDYLMLMKVAKWWRPNKAGKWGLVSADRWGALPKKYSPR